MDSEVKKIVMFQFAETDSYEIKWQIVNYDVVFSKFVLYEYDPSLQPVERITPKTLNW